MQCRDCKFWQGNKYSKKSCDCYRVIAHLNPDILNCTYTTEDGDEVKFTLPFDPHDHPHWMQRSEEYRRIIGSLWFPKGTEFELVDELEYYKTMPDYDRCEILIESGEEK